MGAPKNAVMADMGSSTGENTMRAAKSHRLVTTAPIIMHPGTSILLSDVPKARRTIWGTASPTKATGPATAVIIPARAQEENKIKNLNNLIFTPMEEAYSSPRRKAFKGLARA